jgi:hypothetical protein
MEAPPDREAYVAAWKLRAVVYAFVLMVAAAVLIPRVTDAGEKPLHTLKGSTQQGRSIEVGVRGGRVTNVAVYAIEGSCWSGPPLSIHWIPPSDQHNVTYDSSGGKIRVHEWTNGDFPNHSGMVTNIWMKARMTPDRRTISGYVRFHGVGRTERCNSGEVPFSVRR